MHFILIYMKLNSIKIKALKESLIQNQQYLNRDRVNNFHYL